MIQRHTPQSALLAAITAASVLSGCGASASLDKAEAGAASDTGGALRQLRIDVYPGGSSGLEPQSWFAGPGEAEALEVALARTTVYPGFVRGFRVNPYADIGVPGDEDVPVQALIEATVTDGISGARLATDAEGGFSLSLPEGLRYQVAIIPEDPSRLPFLVLPTADLSRSWVNEINLDYGVPVYGRLLQADGSPPPGSATVALFDPISGVTGAAIPVDPDGYYQVRANPGEVSLIIDDDDGTGIIPRLEVDVTVEPDEPLRRDVTIGTVSAARVRGQVFDQAGRALADAELRFRALELDGVPYPTDFVRSTETDGGGIFNRDLAWGTWEVEVIPPYESAGNASPQRFTLEVDGGDVVVPDVTLEPPTAIDATVYGVDGEPLPGVIVTFTEVGYKAWSWTAISDTAGRIALDVPRGPLLITLSPPNGDAAITTLSADGAGDLPRLSLRSGQPVDGAVTVDDEPVPYALVEVRDTTGALLGTTLTDGGGAFEVLVRP
jgi:hypothetical protein